MIYLPGRALFIHIPRTGGNSITSAISTRCAGNGYDIFVGTGSSSARHFYHLSRHARACLLKKFITDWDSIFKFAIYRPDEERIESIKKLVERDFNLRLHESPSCSESWRKVLESEDRSWYWENMREHDLNYFIKDYDGSDLGVEVFDYHKLNEVWPHICFKCDIEFIELPHLNRSAS